MRESGGDEVEGGAGDAFGIDIRIIIEFEEALAAANE